MFYSFIFESPRFELSPIIFSVVHERFEYLSFTKLSTLVYLQVLLTGAMHDTLVFQVRPPAAQHLVCLLDVLQAQSLGAPLILTAIIAALSCVNSNSTFLGRTTASFTKHRQTYPITCIQPLYVRAHAVLCSGVYMSLRASCQTESMVEEGSHSFSKGAKTHPKPTFTWLLYSRKITYPRLIGIFCF